MEEAEGDRARIWPEYMTHLNKNAIMKPITLYNKSTLIRFFKVLDEWRIITMMATSE